MLMLVIIQPLLCSSSPLPPSSTFFTHPLNARVVGVPQMTSQPVSSIALWGLSIFRPLHSLMLSSHLFFCLPCLLPLFTVLCEVVLVRPDERDTCSYRFNVSLFTMVRRSSCGPTACWILFRLEATCVVTYSQSDFPS